MSYKIGQRVEVPGKDCQGVIAYIGHSSFAPGKWIGVILDEPKGKNNGTIKGQSYFKCAENHGMFVRQSQLILLDEAGNRTEPASPSSAGSNATTPDETSAARARSRLNSISTRRRNEPTAVRRKTSPAHTRQQSDKLSGSRLSLAGSRTLLSAPSTESLSGSHHERKDGGESLIPAPTSTKGASFVEKSPSTSSPPGKKPKAQDDHNNTGFVETLKPQFVPGQVMAGSAAAANVVEEKLSHLQLQQENENLKSQVRDLTEKVETLRVKRMQDKERIKDFEKTKLQVDQLIEFKTKVMESQASLQRELQRARQEAREAHAAREQFQEEMADLAETVEMATLDKEMAEEKAETLQIELEQLKEKLEEQTLDLEILRTEVSERTAGGGSTAGVSNYEIKQLEQQNNRLRETLVRMRDLSAHEKHEFQKLQKDLDQKKSEILELGRTKEKLSTRVEEMEHQIADLQEQVDAALGAEEMVEVLGEKKMALEEKVAELEEAVADLEALQDMSDQLAESSKELELELREELDLALGAARDAYRHRDAALETLADRELTITKFRELTHQLQEQCLQLQQRVQSTETSKFGMGGAEQQLAEILDFQKTFAETRAQTKAVDLELRRLEAEEARNHVKYLLSFMPPAFLARGGDHDAILTLLLIPRMIQKTEILMSQVREKYRSLDKVDRTIVLKGHSVAQYTFRSRLCSYMYALQTFLGCFESALNVCSPEMLLKTGAVYPEMAAQEKSLDSLIDLAKKDQLDENLPMDAIEKCCGYFCTMFSVLFGETINQARLIVNGTRMLDSACDAITTDAAAIKTLIQGDSGDIGLLCQHAETTCEVIQQHLKSARRRVLTDHAPALHIAESNLGLDKDCSEQLFTCYQHAVKMMKTLQILLKSAVQAIITNGDLDTGLSVDKLKEMASISCEKVYDTEDIGPVATIKGSLSSIQQLAANLAQKMAECENELAISGHLSQQREQNAENESVQPIKIRAQAAKKEAEEIKILSRKLEARDSDILEARLALREKQEELCEMILRKDVVEKKLATQQHEHELNVEKLKRKLEEALNQLKRKEKEFEETMDHLQTDIDSLEIERGQLKEKLKSVGKKTMLSASGTDNISGSITTTSGLQSIDNKFLMQEITALKEALNSENQQRKKLMSDILRQKLESLDPIISPLKQESIDAKIQELKQKTNDLSKNIKQVMTFPIVPDLRRNKAHDLEGPPLEKALPVYQLLQRQIVMKGLKERADQLINEVLEEVIQRTVGGMAEANFAVFPNREMAAAMQKNQLLAAEIAIPHEGQEQVFTVNVGTQELRKIHTLLCY
ncbi:dynactin subunit 1 isoform X1 [Apis mellifera caucasica]|uniref:Dynactin subunit 1 n=1 Tax=Apis mellifera TaxID=7460 RepID=A0A7M7SS08_APIME|nr:dynactin subunit 1 isoform X1 [Apis mellifera]KAG6794915.1 dynactin subunit 1 isoform X1 [Apis mellifera caucasica]|eukprot:XP_026301419.1 dynactin subunit 1 isoform X1 [Apis mellifera]